MDKLDTRFGPLRSALAGKFVFIDDAARVLSLAFTSQTNVILWGPGGHGKSQLVEAALKHLGVWERTFVTSFGPELEEEKLWGGIDLEALGQNQIRYNVEQSFMNSEYVVFEEGFDAPPSALMPLKDVLSRGEFRKHGQNFPLKTKIIILCTNRDPRKFADNDTAALALLERFPLQLEVTWKNYEWVSYALMFEKLGYDNTPIRNTVAYVVEQMGRRDQAISPRNARFAIDAVLSARDAEGGKNALDKSHLEAMRFVTGFELFRDKLDELLPGAWNVYNCWRVVTRAEELCAEVNGRELSVARANELKPKLEALDAEFRKLDVPRFLLENRERAKKSVNVCLGLCLTAISRETLPEPLN